MDNGILEPVTVVGAAVDLKGSELEKLEQIIQLLKTQGYNILVDNTLEDQFPDEQIINVNKSDITYDMSGVAITLPKTFRERYAIIEQCLFFIPCTTLSQEAYKTCPKTNGYRLLWACATTGFSLGAQTHLDGTLMQIQNNTLETSSLKMTSNILMKQTTARYKVVNEWIE